jgi:L-ribulose-5-phosphate 3-epimerase
MKLIPRRSFIRQSAVGLGAAAWLRPGRAASAGPAGFRIFGCDWTLRLACDPAAFTLAAKIGLDGVQVDFGRPEDNSTWPLLFDEAHQDRILEASGRSRVAIASLALGALNIFPYKSDAATEQWVIGSVAVARRMRQRVVLLAFFSNGDLVDDAAGVSEVIRRLKRLAPRAEAAGVIYGIESWLKVPDLERILDAVNSPSIQVYYDVGNMQKVGEDVGSAIRRLGRERICEIHFKDYDDLYGKGSMDFPNVRRALDAIGYRGWVGIEGVKIDQELGVEGSIRYDLEYLRPIFPRA